MAPPNDSSGRCTDDLAAHIIGSRNPLNLSRFISIDPIMKDLKTTTDSLITPSLSSSSSSPSPSSSTPSSITKTSSIIDEYYLSFIPKIELPDMNVWTKHINSVISQKLDNLIIQNTQVLAVGAALGAAISAGVAIGCFSFASVIFNDSASRSSGSKIIKKSFTESQMEESSSDKSYKFSNWIWTKLFWYRGNKTICEMDKVINENESSSHSSANTVNNNVNVVKIKSKYQENLYIIQGNPNPNTLLEETTTSAQAGNESHDKKRPNQVIIAQCRSCLDSITTALGKNLLTWRQVRKMNVSLVSIDNVTDSSNSALFRSIMKEYPISTDKILVSIVFVSRLESEHSHVQVEVLVAE